MENLVIADGASFPSLPAKNLTFSLMANAVRVAERAFA
jgi:choline dehydrogenase-like flavoprotein